MAYLNSSLKCNNKGYGYIVLVNRNKTLNEFSKFFGYKFARIKYYCVYEINMLCIFFIVKVSLRKALVKS